VLAAEKVALCADDPYEAHAVAGLVWLKLNNISGQSSVVVARQIIPRKG
jgi:hypothetical protein